MILINDKDTLDFVKYVARGEECKESYSIVVDKMRETYKMLMKYFDRDGIVKISYNNKYYKKDPRTGRYVGKKMMISPLAVPYNTPLGSFTIRWCTRSFVVSGNTKYTPTRFKHLPSKTYNRNDLEFLTWMCSFDRRFTSGALAIMDWKARELNVADKRVRMARVMNFIYGETSPLSDINVVDKYLRQLGLQANFAEDAAVSKNILHDAVMKNESGDKKYGIDWLLNEGKEEVGEMDMVSKISKSVDDMSVFQFDFTDNTYYYVTAGGKRNKIIKLLPGEIADKRNILINKLKTDKGLFERFVEAPQIIEEAENLNMAVNTDESYTNLKAHYMAMGNKELKSFCEDNMITYEKFNKESMVEAILNKKHTGAEAPGMEILEQQ